MAKVECTALRIPYQGTLPATGGKVRQFELPPEAHGALIDAAGTTPAALRVSPAELTDETGDLDVGDGHWPVPSAQARVVYLGPPTGDHEARNLYISSGTSSATAIVTPLGPEARP